MKHLVAVMLAGFVLASLDGCGSSASDGSGGAGGIGAAGAGGVVGSGGVRGSGGVVGSGGQVGSGGIVGSGGRPGTGGRSGGGATGTGGQTGVCPYTVASFSCEAACAKLHDWYARCQNDPAVPEETLAMLSIYAQVEVICTSSCAVVAPSAQAQWACFQGMPDDAPCAAIAGCNATNCP